MRDARRVPPCHRDGIAAAVRDVTGVEAEPDKRRIGPGKDRVDLLRRLDVCGRVRVKAGRQTARGRVARDLVRAIREDLPFNVAQAGASIVRDASGDTLPALVAGIREDEDRRAAAREQPDELIGGGKCRLTLGAIVERERAERTDQLQLMPQERATERVRLRG